MGRRLSRAALIGRGDVWPNHSRHAAMRGPWGWGMAGWEQDCKQQGLRHQVIASRCVINKIST
eukprot:3328734-Prymnesium_polylepis.1